MNQKEYEEKFRFYLMEKIRRQELFYGDSYVKDKTSRLRKLIQILTLKKLLHINENNYIQCIDLIIEFFSNNQTSSYSKTKKYMDYLVVLRVAFEMVNSGKVAPTHTHYSGQRRKK
jgi:hypothetical protein